MEAFDEMEVDSINKNSSVLIFLPGIFEIEELHRLMMDCMVSRQEFVILFIYEFINWQI